MGVIVLCLFLFSCLMLCRSFFRRNLTYRTDRKMGWRPIFFSQNNMKKVDGIGMPEREQAIVASVAEASRIIQGGCTPNEPKMGACSSIFFSQNKMKKIDVTPQRNQTIEASMFGRATRAISVVKRDKPRAVMSSQEGSSVGELRDTETFAKGAVSNGYAVSNYITLTLNEIMMALTRPDIIMLGVYGSSHVKMGYVVERITRRVNRDNLFDLIVRASVTNRPDLKRIQGELGNNLGLQLQEKTLKGRARLLSDKIKMTTKILIILDDVREEINLGNIGVPFGNDHNGCTILLISETQNVLSNQTNAQIKFTV